MEIHHDPTWKVCDFEFGRLLGSGGFGKVYEAYIKKTRAKVAIKTINISKVRGEERMLKREMENQLKVRHPNVLQLYGAFADPTHLFLVLELASNSSLRTVISRSPLDNCKAAHCMKYLSRALLHCHKLKVIHRDLKPDNVLLGNNWDIKVADFGLSVYSPMSAQNTVAGTFYYMAPEMRSGKSYGSSVDIWSLGIICLELLTRKQVIQIVGLTNYDKIEPFVKSQQISERAKQLILKLLVVEPKERMPLDEVLKHPWLNKYTTGEHSKFSLRPK